MSQAKELLELATRLSYFPGAVEQGLAGMLRHLAAAPQPESTQQDAALYRELLYAVSKKWPGESRHETALRYIRRAEEEGSKELGATIRTQGTEE
jgi:hypothetical protein